LQKTSYLLLALARLVPAQTLPAPITYFALDLEERELERNLTQIQQSELGAPLRGKVDTKGLWGTYRGGLRFVEEGGLHQSSAIAGFFDRADAATDFSSSSSADTASDVADTESTPPTTPDDNRPPLHIFFLGSTLGNFSRKESTDFLRSLPLVPGSGDTLLLGLDHDNDKDLVELAYNDKKGITRKFIMNGLKVAGRVLGDENMFDQANWDYYNIYNVEERTSNIVQILRHALMACFTGRHEAYFKSRGIQTIRVPSSKQEITFLENELLRIEVSLKVSQDL
jgi:L-histidine Nalpha-methyltransferase / hercynylcysteine S-oxide synthase